MQYPAQAGAGYIGGIVPIDLEFAGKPIVTAPGQTLKSGTNFLAGTVLGQIKLGAASSAAKAGGNTGNGTFVLDVTEARLANSKAGVYKLRVVDVPAAHGSIWELRDPDNITVGIFNVAGSGGTFTTDSHIKGVITDGGTDFIVGDGFDITVAAGTGKLTTCIAAAIDGSQFPFGILREDTNATSADKTTGAVAIEGHFNEDALTYGAGHTADTLRTALRDIGIQISTAKWSG